ncbi:MAG: hypothetical protein AAF225_13150 [Pseudomonadota bacterium]
MEQKSTNPLASFAQDLVAKATDKPARAFARRHPFLVVLPIAAIILAFYYGLLAAPVFVSETQISIRGKDSAPQPTLLSAFVPTGGGGGLSESVAVKEYIHSAPMLHDLSQQVDLFTHYSAFRVDPFSSMSKQSSREQFLRFYRKRVAVILDREAAIVKIEVHAYDAETALKTAQAIVALSEDYVNELSARIRDETLKDARGELALAQQEVRDVRLTLAEFRNRSGELDPASRGTASVSALISLEADITRLRGELASQLAINREDAPQVQAIEAQIRSLEGQVDNQRRGLASDNSNGTLAEVLRDYEGLVIQREYAETRLTAALAALDGARQLADQRERFVVPIVDPVLASQATKPQRFASFCLGMLMVVIGYGIVRYTIAGIGDHDGAI